MRPEDDPSEARAIENTDPASYRGGGIMGRRSRPLIAGRSDKYGQVYVERVGNTGFDDPSEPIAVFRAQDRFALKALEHYYETLLDRPEVSHKQRESVGRQIAAFRRWRKAHPERIRIPGASEPRTPEQIKAGVEAAAQAIEQGKTATVAYATGVEREDVERVSTPDEIVAERATPQCVLPDDAMRAALEAALPRVAELERLLRNLTDPNPGGWQEALTEARAALDDRGKEGRP